MIIPFIGNTLSPNHLLLARHLAFTYPISHAGYRAYDWHVLCDSLANAEADKSKPQRCFMQPLNTTDEPDDVAAAADPTATKVLVDPAGDWVVVAKGGVARAWRVLREEDPASASVFAYHGRFDLECSEMLTVTHV